MTKIGKKKLIKMIVLIFAVLALIGSLIYSNYTKKFSQKMGEEAGEKVGIAVGTFDGFTVNYKKGLEEAEAEEKQKKLEENNVKYAQRIRQTEKLEVLVVTYNLVDTHTVGNTYSALIFAKSNAVFSVDMGKADVSMSEDNVLTIVLPQPEVDIYIDEKSITKASEMNRFLFDGNAEDGFDAYLNSMATLQQMAYDKAKDSPEFMSEAKASAEEQVTRLANGVSVNIKSIKIEWKEDQ